jgi:hypothetical protein
MKKFVIKKNIFSLILAVVLTITFSSCATKRVDDDNDNTVEEPKLSIESFVKELSVDEYTNTQLTDTVYGLSEPKNVGVDKTEGEKTLYAIPADSEFTGEIIDYSTYSTTADNDFDKLKNIFDYAKNLNNSGITVKIKLPKATINLDCAKSPFSGYVYVLEGFNGLYIEGNDTEFKIQYSNTDWKGFISITNSKNIYMQGIKVDYEVPSALSGTISAFDDSTRSVTVNIFEEFNELIEKLVTNHISLQSYVEFDSIINAPKQKGNFATNSEGYLSNYNITGDAVTGYKITVTFSETYSGSYNTPTKGDYVSLAYSMYGNNGFTVSSSENIYFENVVLYTAPGMGLVGINVKNLYVNRFYIKLKENTNRKMTVTADGMHFASCSGDVFITNSIIENSHDDALNIKTGYYYNFTSYDILNKTITINKKTSAIETPVQGDVIEIYDENNFELKAVLTVKSVNGNSNSYVITVEESLIKLGLSEWGNCRATVVTSVPNFKFTNNIVRNKRNRGILVQVRNAVIENNTFENVGHGAISIHSSLDVFNEATMPKDITIKNNKLINNNYLYGLSGDIAIFATANEVAPVGTITGITVENNFIAKNGNAGIAMHGVGNSQINYNLFYNTARTVVNPLYESAIELYNAGNLKIEGNYNYNTLESDSFAGIIPSGLTDTATIELKNNSYLKYQEIAGEVTTTEVSKIDSQIIVDGNLTEWGNTGTEIEMVGSSEATGNEIAFSVYSNVFNVKMCKLAWSESGIYIAFDVFDNKYDFKTQNNFWNGDCFELFYTTVLNMPNADFSLFKESGDTFQAAFVPSWTTNYTIAEGRTSSSILSKSTDWQVKVIYTSEGYSGEIYIPFTSLSNSLSTIQAGDLIAIGFVFADNDRDDLGRKRVQVSNCPHFVEAWKTKTAKMPLFKFV